MLNSVADSVMEDDTYFSMIAFFFDCMCLSAIENSSPKLDLFFFWFFGKIFFCLEGHFLFILSLHLTDTIMK